MWPRRERLLTQNVQPLHSMFFPAGNLKDSPKDQLAEFAYYFQQQTYQTPLVAATRVPRSVYVRRIVRSDVYTTANLNSKPWETAGGVPTQKIAINAKCAAPSFAVFPAGYFEGSPKDSRTEFADSFQRPHLSATFGSASRALRSVCVRRVVRSVV